MYAGSLFRSVCLFILSPLAALPVLASEGPTVQDMGYLWVTSQPKYAQVYLDSKSVAATPISRLLELEPGQYEIALSGQGHKLYQEMIVIRRGQVLEINVILARLDSGATAESTQRYVEAYLTIRSEPSGADVYLDDERIGRTPITDHKVEPGEQQDRRLRVVKSEYKAYEKWIDVGDRIKLHESIELEPLKQVVDTTTRAKPRSRVRFTINTHVIILFILASVMIAILAARVIIRLRRRVGDD